MSATIRLVFATLAGFLFGFLVGAFMYFETVDPAVSQNVVLMGFVWILFSWVGARLSYSVTKESIEREEWEAAALRRDELNRLSGRMTTGNAVVVGTATVCGGECKQD
jgi:Na+/melibiose symporter-like transporter